MKRDLDLIRDILLAVEAQPADTPFAERGVGEKRFGEHDGDTVAEHVYLLREAGYVEGSVSRSGTWSRVYAANWEITRITMAGHDFLDTIRHPEVYTKTKSWIAEKGGDVGLSVVKAAADGFAKAHVGCPAHTRCPPSPRWPCSVQRLTAAWPCLLRKQELGSLHD